MRVSQLLKELNITYLKFVDFASLYCLEINGINQKLDGNESKFIKDCYLNPNDIEKTIAFYINIFISDKNLKSEELIFLLWVNNSVFYNNYELNIEQISNQFLKYPKKLKTKLYEISIEVSSEIIKVLTNKLRINYNDEIAQIFFEIWLDSKSLLIETSLIKNKILYFILHYPNKINNVVKKLTENDILDLVNTFVSKINPEYNFKGNIDFESISRECSNNDFNLKSLLLLMNLSLKEKFNILGKKVQINQTIKNVYEMDYIGSYSTYWGFGMQFEVDINILIENELDIIKYFVSVSEIVEYVSETEYTKFIIRKTPLSDIKCSQNADLLYFIISKIESIYNNPNKIKVEDFKNVNYKKIFDLESKLVGESKYGIFISKSCANTKFIKNFKHQKTHIIDNSKYDMKLLPFGNIDLFNDDARIIVNTDFRGDYDLHKKENELVFEGNFNECEIVFNDVDSLKTIIENYLKKKRNKNNFSNERTGSNVNWDLWNNDLDADQQDPDFYNQF